MSECKKCGSSNFVYQTVNETKIVKRYGILRFLLYGWILWFFITIPMLIIKIFRPNKYKSKTVVYKVCQNCGYKQKV